MQIKPSLFGVLLALGFSVLNLDVLATENPAVLKIYQTPPEGFRDVVQALDQRRGTWDSCRGVASQIAELGPAFDPTQLNRDYLRPGAPSSKKDPLFWMNKSARGLDRARFALMDRWAAAHVTTETRMSPEDVETYGAALRVLRTFAESMMAYTRSIQTDLQAQSRGIELQPRSQRLTPEGQFIWNTNVLSSSEIATYYKPNGAIDIESVIRDGDIIITRARPLNKEGESGTAVSPAIAAISSGNGDAQFSHALIVRKDADGITRIEALIEDGVKLRSWDGFLQKNWARFMVLRFTGDPNIASRGVNELYQTVANQLSRGVPIHYNFAMKDLNEVYRPCDFPARIPMLMCAQPGRLAFEMASGGNINIAPYQTRIAFKTDWFPEMLGIGNNRDVDHPVSYERSGLLVPVLEYRDPLLGHEARLADLTFNWIASMLDKGYRIRPTKWAKFVREVAWRIRQLPEPVLGVPGLSNIRDKFSRTMTQNQAEVFTSLQNVFDILFPYVREIDDAFLLNPEQGGMMLSQAHLWRALDEAYKENRGQIQFWLFDPVLERQIAENEIRNAQNRGLSLHEFFLP